MKKLTIIAVVAAGLALSAATSQATLVGVTPGNSGIGTGSATGSGGTLVGSISAYNYTFGSGADTGTIAESVYSGDTENPLTGLTYIFTITISTGDLDAIALVAPSWGPQVYLGYGITGGTVSAGNLNAGDGTVNFSWTSSPTSGTFYLIVGTGITSDEMNYLTLQDTGDSPNEPALVPVPEASTAMAGALMLLPLGFGAFRALCKERAT